ncbi:MAG: aminotransferase class III-fold pyridoxal phosphate-dependent enzyme [Nannocystaceae bacterium]|nr:aminotransferase class III-fold pyridoxal phosphate-dependent enzyme [Nannocystaceae bacterium]
MTSRHPILQTLRTSSGPATTAGVSDRWIDALADDTSLGRALSLAASAWEALSEDERALVKAPESEAAATLQQGYANFYSPSSISPFVALAAAGPWVITAYGAVLYETGGYGMLGAGHNPQHVEPHLGSPQVMANVMTPGFAQRRFIKALASECAYGRGSNPFERFACLNSGSEGTTLALRLSDMNAFALTEPGGRYEGRLPWVVSMVGSFHGRTDQPARISDSTRASYAAKLASHRERTRHKVVPLNDVAALHAVFADAERNNAFIEAVVVEPVQGEGNPGMAITREFYDAARTATAQADAFLIVDAIQAGLRTYGCLSHMSAPGFTDAAVPDIEVWSKALNAGQYPLSVVGMGPRASAVFTPGVYGNTMTSNPRALDVATSVLQGIDESLRSNIRERGLELVEKLTALGSQMPEVFGKAQGTGLLTSIEVNPSIPVVADGGLERVCRERGLNVIHGGPNSLRFTPHFAISSQEIDLVVELVAEAAKTFG